MSLLFNMLSRLVIAFLPRSKRLLISWLQSPSTKILKPKKIRSATASAFPTSICHKVMGQMPWSQFFEWVLSHLFYSLTFKRLISSSSLSAIRVLSSAYLRLLIFLSTILIPVCDSSSLAFCMTYSGYKLNKKGDSRNPCIPFPVLNQSVVPRKVLIAASWPAYRFLQRQVRWSGIHISLRILHSLLWSTKSKPFAESVKQMFFGNFLAFSMIQQMLTI